MAISRIPIPVLPGGENLKYKSEYITVARKGKVKTFKVNFIRRLLFKIFKRWY